MLIYTDQSWLSPLKHAHVTNGAVVVNMDMRACMADEGTKEKDSLLFVRVHLRCRRREEAADPGLYGFRDTSLLSTEKKKVSSTTTLSASFSPSFSLISLNYFLSFWFLQMNSCPAHGVGRGGRISTLWMGNCSCSCCWCQREATPRAPHWSLSSLCHHRTGLRLEEDDNGRSKQFCNNGQSLPCTMTELQQLLPA